MNADIKYLCVDDQADNIEHLLAAVESHAPRLKIAPQPPTAFDHQTEEIMQRHRSAEMDGLLVDLRLDEPGPGIEPVHYTAQGLAQQLRTRCVGEHARGFPVVLWSVDARLLQFYHSDSTSHDLFDLVLHKEQLVDDAQEVSAQLVSLVEGYRMIASKLETFAAARPPNGFAQIVAEPVEGLLDPRVADSLSDASFGPVNPFGPAHEYALHILHFLIRRSGPLITEDDLCARLGVAKTSSGLPELLTRLPQESRYQGPFSSAWPRWWSALVEKWWRGLVDGLESRPLASVPAARRVEILGEKLGVGNLQPAAAIMPGYSTCFTTICQHLRAPLDPVDGFALAERSPRPWLEKRYVSEKVALSPAKHNFREPLDGLERRRRERLIIAQKKNGGKE